VNHRLVYLDSSAILKIVVSEPESKALLKLLEEWPLRVSSELARTEVLRALRRADVSVAQFRRGQKVLERIGMISVDIRVLGDAAMLKPVTLRSLDSIHLATAASLGRELESLVTYDHRLAEAARAASLSVWSPS
jgi:predicted nucleic acid-binding protein